jgi:hypothetical protein
MATEHKIDIVYLWVNGNDPVWRVKRRQAVERLSAGNRGEIAVYGNVEGRFRDNDELRYSLRALQRFFPDHGHVYIVTDAQAPTWLRRSDRITVVDHRELIPAAALPTFDSGNIESYIHRIPNLSERYFYFNDDVFFGAPVKVSDWFRDGGVRSASGQLSSDGVFAAWSDEPMVSDEPLRPDAPSLENACRMSGQWLAERGIGRVDDAAVAAGQPGQGRRREPYRHTFRTFAHSPRPMLRSLLYELEGQAPSMFERVRSTVFRIWDKPTIVSDFVLRWALAHGVAEIRDYRYLHISTGDTDSVSGPSHPLERLSAQFGALDFFCINDTTDDAQPDDVRLTRVRQRLQTLLPFASSFEQSPAAAQKTKPSTRPHTAAKAATSPVVELAAP